MIGRKKLIEFYPYYVILPVGAKSPTGSIYKSFDIVKQTKAVSTFSNAVRTVRCSEPFILSVMVKGKTKEIMSRKR